MGFDDHPDEEWIEEESDCEDDLLLCPSCRQPVHEETQNCPHCGDWITPVYAEKRYKRIIWITAAVLLVIALVWMTIH